MRNAKGLANLGFVAALFALILTPMFFDAGSVRAQGAIPADLYGSGPNSIEADAVVVASIGELECETTTADSSGGWFIRVYPGDCGGAAVSGAMITFTINGDPAAESVTFEPGWSPTDDPANGFQLTLWVAPEATPEATPAMPDPPAPPSLSRSSGLAIFSGGSVQQLEAAAVAACPGDSVIWVNEPHDDGYLAFVPKAEFDIVNVAFMSAYGDGFDAPEAVIVTECSDGMDDTMGDDTMGDDTMGDDTMGDDTMGDDTMGDDTMGDDTTDG